MKLLIFCDWYIPAFRAGGPVRSVANLVEALGKDFDISVVTSDRDLGDDKAYEGIPTNQWLPIGKTHVMYLSPEKQNREVLADLMKQEAWDRIYLNSMFSKSFAITPLVLAKKFGMQHKVILAPRGMLGKGALRIKPLKKKVFLGYAKRAGWYSNIHWHATGEEEAAEIRNILGGRSKITVVPNIPVLHQPITRQKTAGTLDLLFYSRISPKKNLFYALEVLYKFSFSGVIKLFIYGPAEDENYWKKCLALIEQMHSEKPEISIEYKGEVQPEQSAEMLGKSHVFFLPTHHENFGHVIAEALSTGMPLIISNNTPWRQLEKHGAGFDLSLKNPEDFSRAIQHFIDLDQAGFDLAAKQARSYFEARLHPDEIVQQMKALFLHHA